ncbi:hypothetical protein L873DRAFT_1706529, partial [Choiromyces venosus 120613-1]
LAVIFGTFLLMNIVFLHRNLEALEASVQNSIRQKMSQDSQSSHPKSAYQEKRPSWKYWKTRAQGLSQAEEHRAKLKDKESDRKESGWWYWYFTAIFTIVVIPAQELTFITRTLRRMKVKKFGPLKKLAGIPWAPIWVVQLAVVYAIILVGHTILFLVLLVRDAALRLWNGNDIPEKMHNTTPDQSNTT